jgi:hypothetical protein
MKHSESIHANWPGNTAGWRYLVATLATMNLGACATSAAAPPTAPSPPGASAAPGVASSPAPAALPPLDPNVVSQNAGAKATPETDGVVRVSWARDDVPLTIDGIPLPPAAGLGTWAAFTPAPGGAMMMGDTVVFEDEVAPAMDAAFAAGLEVTALHNHFFYDVPHVYFMHIGGTGDPAALARGVRSVWGAIKEVRHRHPLPAAKLSQEAPRKGPPAAEPLTQIMGTKPSTAGGVVKYTFAREGEMHGVRVGGSMGLTTWIAFSGSDALSAACGDVIMTAEQVQPVLRELRAQGFQVVALHNHMIGDAPNMYFTHFWATGAATDLARRFEHVRQKQKAAPEANAGHAHQGAGPH